MDWAGADVGYGAPTARWGWWGVLVAVGASALVVGGSAGGIAQDGVGGHGGDECGGVGVGMNVGVVGADQAPVGVGDLGW